MGFNSAFKGLIIFLISGLLYMTFYRNSRVMSYYFVVLLNQTAEVKTLPIVHVTQFHNCRPALSQMVSHSRGSC